MDRKLVWNRISQLPLAMSGIIFGTAVNGIGLSIFNDSISIPNCEMPLLP
ncbi:hypothetical protein DJ90_5967 [Paenibacillus macerans]|uniref:Uncharacterized protein n=1 Tax=Paenibacillus macerans TaxID=44252 RepID=A0A090Y951_PAEMA|nr:hypothetical protein DJ90_5967 [Paenibacillus macerans]